MIEVHHFSEKKQCKMDSSANLKRFLCAICLCLISVSCIPNDKISNRVDIEDLDSVIVPITNSAHDKNTTALKQPDLMVNFLEEYRRLRAKKSEEAMRSLATIGLISGTLKVEEAMKSNLNNISSDLFVKFNVSTPKENMERLMVIEETIERDKCSIGVLNSMLEFARNAKTFDAFQKDMQRILKEVSHGNCVIITSKFAME